VRAATQELSGYRFLYRATHVEGFVTKPLHTATQTKTPRARRRRSNQTEHARLPDLHRIHFDPFGKALHPRRCRRAHRGDPRNSRAAVTPHATTIAAATSDPHTPPRHVRRSQRPARRSQRPAQFTSGRHTTCDYYRGRHLRPPPPSPLPRSPVAPCDCVCEVIARSTRDSLDTCEVCAGNEWHRKNTHQRQAVSRVTRCGRSSLRSLTRCGRVLCCAARYDASDCCAAVVNLRALRCGRRRSVTCYSPQ
jgi:hypothetical protein